MIGFACTIPVGGKHIYEPSIQMRNRGNGKGGGIAACGLVPEEMGVSRRMLDEDYILQVALLDPGCARRGRESAASSRSSTCDHGGHDPDGGRLPRRPAAGGPARRTWCATSSGSSPTCSSASPRRNGLASLPERDVEDEFVFQNSIRLNDEFYASLGDKRAFVLSHAPEPDDPQDRRLRRGRRAVLPAWRIHAPTSGSPTSAIRPRAASGIRAARIRSSA